MSAEKHTLRTGIDLHRIKSRYVDLEDITGTFNFANPADFLLGRPERFRQRFSTESLLHNYYSGLFLQHDYRTGNQLTLSAGMQVGSRIDRRRRNNLAPRIGVALESARERNNRCPRRLWNFFNRGLLRTLDDFTLTSHSMLIDTNIRAHAGILKRLNFPMCSIRRITQYVR